MLRNQKLPNAAWIAHDTETSDVIHETLDTNLCDCKMKFLRTYIEDHECYDAETLVDEFEDQIPKNIKFVIVTLEPRYETEKS